MKVNYSILQKEKKIFYVIIKHLEKSNTKKIQEKWKGKSVEIVYIRFLIFLLPKYFYKSYHDYWDLITKFWPGSTKWKIPFKTSMLCKKVRKKSSLPILYKKKTIKKILNKLWLDNPILCFHTL